MNKKTLFIIALGALLIAGVALLWWWFLGQAPKTLEQAGSFNTAQNKNLPVGNQNTSSVLIPTVEGLDSLASSTQSLGATGIYVLKKPNGTILGSYKLSPLSQPPNTYAVSGGQNTLLSGQYVVVSPSGQTLGAYTVVSTPGSTNYTFNPGPTLRGGQYTLVTPNGTKVGPIILGTGTTTPNLPSGTYTIQDGGGNTLGTYLLDQNGGTFIQTVITQATSTNTTYATTSSIVLGNINTTGVNWFFDASSTISFNGASSTLGGQAVPDLPGSVFNPTATNNINGSNPSGGILPNFDYSSGKKSDNLGLVGATIGAVAGATVACLIPYTGSALGLGAGVGIAAGTTAAGALGAGALGASSIAGMAGVSVPTGAIGGGFAAVSSPALATAEGASGAFSETALTGGGPAATTGSGAAGVATVWVTDFSNLIAQVMNGMSLSGILSLTAANYGAHLSDQSKSVLDCVARTAARAALRQITTSVVSWINSGFQGNPSFVTNPTQFFTNVADVAAGQFIQGSALSFLCSPFRAQIRVAIAYSYAHRNELSCTLTGINNNIKNFTNQIFSSNANGWPTFLSFTMDSTNNPYGAYAYATNGLNSSIANAQGQFQIQLNQGRGFLSLQQKQNCKNQLTPPANVNPNQFVQNLGSGGNGTVVISGGLGRQQNQSVTDISQPESSMYEVCDLVNTTPGSIVAGAVDKTLGTENDYLNMAKNFDEVVSALVQYLMTQAVSPGGLLGIGSVNASSNVGYSQDQLQAQSTGQDLVTKMQAETTALQQLGSIKQGEIQDIQAGQSKLNDLSNCWNSAKNRATIAAQTASSSILAAYAQDQSPDPTVLQAYASSTAQITKANQIMQEIANDIAGYESKVTDANSQITKINTNIAQLEQFQSRALSLNSTNDAAQLTSEYLAAPVHITQTDLTTEQQNRTTLQSTLATLSGNINISLAQCHAI